MTEANRRGAVLVYGATGHTGRLVVAELVAMGVDVVVAGRSRPRLEAFADTLPRRIPVRVAQIEDDAALRAMCVGITTVVNTAVSAKFDGPLVARAAIAAGCHYVDVIGDAMSVRAMIDELGSVAVAAGVALLPACAFFSVLSDLLLTVAAADLGEIADIDVAYWVDGWRPSGLAYASFLELTGKPMLEHRHGPVVVPRVPATRIIDFTPPIGARRVTMWPGPELVLTPRHLPVAVLRTSMTTSTLAPRPFGPVVPQVARLLALGLRHTPTAGPTERLFALTTGGRHDPILHDPTRFAIVAHLRGATTRTAVLRGSGIYTITIPIAARIAAQTLAPTFTGRGPQAPAEIVDAAGFLDELAEYGLTRRIIGEGLPTTESRTAQAGG